MIKIRNLTKAFNGNPVLNGIDLDIEDNKTIVILGPSGQGKTVFIKTLVGLIEPDSGSALYKGMDLFSISRRKYQSVRKQMAFVFQMNALFDFINVRENLSLYLRMHTRTKDGEILQKVKEALNFVGLDHSVMEKFPEELSGGMSKRVAIARAMIKKPEMIFYDEPTVGLDEGNVAKVVELISLLKNQICATSIIVTHDIHLMREVADQVALLKEGRIVFAGTPEEIGEDRLHELYATGELNGKST